MRCLVTAHDTHEGGPVPPQQPQIRQKSRSPQLFCKRLHPPNSSTACPCGRWDPILDQPNTDFLRISARHSNRQKLLHPPYRLAMPLLVSIGKLSYLPLKQLSTSPSQSKWVLGLWYLILSAEISLPLKQFVHQYPHQHGERSQPEEMYLERSDRGQIPHPNPGQSGRIFPFATFHSCLKLFLWLPTAKIRQQSKACPCKQA